MILTSSGIKPSLSDIPKKEGRYYTAYFVGLGPVGISCTCSFDEAALMFNDTYIQHPDGYPLVYSGKRGRMLDCILMGKEFEPETPFDIAARLSPYFGMFHIKPKNGLKEGELLESILDDTDTTKTFWDHLNEFFTTYYEIKNERTTR